jgi:hypothetical protein
MSREFLLACLSERGPGTSIEAMIPKMRRKGLDKKAFLLLVNCLKAEGKVEQFGQYIWLKKGVTECEQPVKPKRYRVLAYA